MSEREKVRESVPERETERGRDRNRETERDPPDIPRSRYISATGVRTLSACGGLPKCHVHRESQKDRQKETDRETERQRDRETETDRPAKVHGDRAIDHLLDLLVARDISLCDR